MDQTLLTQMLSGGGVLAFAIAVWMQGREHGRILRSIEKVLAKLEERADQDERSRAATPVHGVPITIHRRRRAPTTEEE